MRGLIAGVVLLTGLTLATVFFLVRPTESPEPRAQRPADSPKAAAGTATVVTEAGPAQLAEAQRLFNTGNTSAARDLYVRLRAQARGQSNVATEAAAAFGLGTLEHQHGQSDAARAAYADAARLFQQQGDLASQARVFVALGDLEKDTFHPREAAQHYRAGMALWARAPEPKNDTHTLLNVERAPLMPAGEIRARAVLEQADKIFDNVGDDEGRGDIAMLLGQLAWNLDAVAAAHTSFEVARGRFETARATAKQVEAMLRVATTETYRGHNIAAKETLYAADRLVGDNAVGQARIRWRRGDIERLQGVLPAARSEYEAALAVLAAAPHPEAAEVRLRLAQVAAALDDMDTARREAEAALQLYRQRKDARGEAAAALAAGRIAARAGDAASVATHLQIAQQKSGEARDTMGEARALLALAEAYARQTTPEAANAASQASALASEQFAKLRLPLGQVLAVLAEGDAARAAGDRSGAANSYRRAANLMTAITNPVEDAGLLLGLPPVARLVLEVPGEFPVDVGDPVDPEVVRYARVTRAANIAAYPNANAEGQTLVTETRARLTAATEFVRGGN
ncbi:MAG: hypothetical protein FJX64_07680 [Alphaproteobacteria bacterium]|nr:hypothetical protein [Alphaproteobacteria bacterium]